MISKDKVQIITGVNFTNVLLGMSKPVLDSGTLLVSLNPGPPSLAGKGCNPHFFSVSYQNDGVAEAMGEYFNRKGIKDVYLLAPNYPAGKDLMTGFKRFYKGEIKKEVYTQFEQLDYAAEIASIRAEKPKAVFYFYPGSLGINFLRQYTDAGLKSEIPLYGPSFSLDQTIFAASGDTPLGAYATTFWTESLQNTQNQEFVAAFEKAYGRLPSAYAAQAYDGARLLDAAIKETNGKVDNADLLAQAIKKANFASVRGSFKFNNNNFPIHDYYITRVEKDSKGRTVMKPLEKVLSNHSDAYAKDCLMQAQAAAPK